MKRIFYLTEKFFYNPEKEITYFCDECYEMWYLDCIKDTISLDGQYGAYYSTKYLCFKCQSEGK